jgi:low molecular weight protein-tyrosine phosphatase
MKILFVCMGNICRSPTAESVVRRAIREAGMDGSVQIDSAGTHGYHVGLPPDQRAQQAAASRGYDISTLRGRQVERADFEQFDLVLAMDQDNLRNLKRLCPARFQHKVRLLLSYSRKYPNLDVPDPYYGGNRGFEDVLDMVEDAAKGLIKAIREGG